jgi:hypothetical protein
MSHEASLLYIVMMYSMTLISLADQRSDDLSAVLTALKAEGTKVSLLVVE